MTMQVLMTPEDFTIILELNPIVRAERRVIRLVVQSRKHSCFMCSGSVSYRSWKDSENGQQQQ
uniref:Uncharacterized protein n=1 Tax=Octopus bimaculoides TaxID=37653 RepID=A0A0L8HYX3_OCTBM